MKKTILLFVVSVIMLPIFANTDKTTDEAQAKTNLIHQEKFLRNTGGFIIKPESQKGEIVYVNCQKRAQRVWLKESAEYFAKFTKFKITVKDGSFEFENPEIQGNATLFVIDDEKMPTLLIAPEARWAIVNVAPIAKEKRAPFFEARVKKELSRGFAFLCGASNSQYPRSLTRGIVDHADLDKNPNFELPADVIMRFTTYMSTLGVTPAITSTYRRACQQGWAPAPTNDVQKAIWDKVHAAPKNPMKIEFNPKKGR